LHLIQQKISIQIFDREVAMSPSLTFELLLAMVIILFTLGMASTITGIIILTTRAAGKDFHTLAAQTTRLAQKGLAEEVAGLVGNATSLLDAMNQLIRTAAGVGVFLTFFGLVLMGSAAFLALKIY
jgi:hypothetical protein